MTSLGAMLRRDLPPEDLIQTARTVAPMLDELWIVEDLEWPGGVAQLAAVLEATDDEVCGRPIIGHGIAPAPFRNPAALAMEWATLARMYPGRLHGGIGHGLPAWMDQVGERVASPLTLLRETIECTRNLLHGGPVNYTGRYVTLSNVELVFPPVDVPPVLAGVTGPKSLELSGLVADGTVLCEGHDLDQVAAAKTKIDRGRAEPGAPTQHHFTLYVGYYLGDLADLPPPPTDGPEGGWAAVADNVDDMVAHLQPLWDADIDSIVLVPFGETIEQLNRFDAEVLPQLRT